jgi:hypothetical protein
VTKKQSSGSRELAMLFRKGGHAAPAGILIEFLIQNGLKKLSVLTVQVAGSGLD